MTVPNGAAGIDATGWPGIISADGHAPTTAADLSSQTQDNVTTQFKQKFVGTAGSGTSVFTSSTGPLAEVFAGLPDILGASLPLRIIAAIAGQLLGVDPGSLIDGDTHAVKMEGVIAALEKVPGVSELISTIAELTGVDLHTIFDGIELTPGGILTAIERAATQIIQAITTAITGLAAGTPLALMFALAQNAAQQVGAVAGAITGVGAEILGILSALQGQVNVNSAQINALQTATSTSPTGSSITFNGSLQSEWTVLTGTAGFNAGALQPVLPFAAYFDIKPATDSHGITFTVVNKIWGTMRGIICADTGFTNYAALEVYTDGYGNDYVRICNGSAPLVAVATPQQYNGAISGGYTYSFDYHQSTNSYVASLNGNPILTWIDSSNLVTHGSTKRTTGLAMAINSGGYGGQGFGVSNFHVYDGTP